jgi:hypothetical protein
MSEPDLFIGKCIYCGGKGETNEHIFPLSLGGETELLNASCEACRKITSQWERNQIKEIWEEARAALNYPTRHKPLNERVFHFDAILLDGSEKKLSFNSTEVAGLASFFEYGPPGILVGSQPSDRLSIIGYRQIAFGTSVSELFKKNNIKSLRSSLSKKAGFHFERMVLRIAYCIVVYKFGIDCFEECHALPAVLGASNNIGHIFGCDENCCFTPGIDKVYSPNAAKIFLQEKNGRTYAVVKLKFFAASDAPEYIAVVGILRK